MNKHVCFTLLLLLMGIAAQVAHSQSYTNYFTGDTTDVQTQTQPVTVLMGGASESDPAMAWFLQHTGGGDIVVLRTSGADGYNNYLFSELGVPVNSVQTIVCNDASAAYNPYVIQQVRNAEGLWFAGGNQWSYLSFWNNTPLDTAFNYLINEKRIPIGGLSAGMAIQGSIIYTGQNGSVVSPAALLNPYNAQVTLLKDDFLHNPWLQNVVTDTHYDNPDRRGRHVAFLARIAQDYGITAYGIACNEYTAVCIDPNGLATVFGEYPAYEDYAYFLQVNCAQPNMPETCQPNQPLTWNRNQQAVAAYKVAGTPTGANTFDLSNWNTGTGGTWQHWYVNNGIFTDLPNVEPLPCLGVNTPDIAQPDAVMQIYPNPVANTAVITLPHSTITGAQGVLRLYSLNGQEKMRLQPAQNTVQLNLNHLPAGIYLLQFTNQHQHFTTRLIKE